MGKFCTSCGTEAATTMMDAGIGKVATSFGGTVVGELAEAANVGGDLTDALVKGTVKGTFNAASGAVGVLMATPSVALTRCSSKTAR